MNRANFACEHCGATTKTLNVHHRKYVPGKKPWEYDEDQLECLCEDCHGKEHGIESKEGSLLTQAMLLVIQHPAAARAIQDPEILANIDCPGIDVLRELVRDIHSIASPTTAALLERWRDRLEYADLVQLAQAEPLVADDDAAAKKLVTTVELLKHQGQNIPHS